ncbi:hypothetical protein FOVSG1_013682 [Fusarium oxysporum f. sp. vasinfectum]
MTTDYKFEGWMGEDERSAEGNMVWQEYKPKKWEETDVDIRITHCGICGSDIHVLRSGWRQAPYPVVVGHEIVGVAVRVGSQAEGGIKVGDIVGVGAQSDACLNRKLGDDNQQRPNCNECASGEENYCTRMAPTYGSKFLSTGDKTQGGYARYHRCPSHFVFRIPEGVAPEHAAPLLCGGVTVYSPLKRFGAGPGKKVGIVGVGGLGHFAVLFARALGADEVVGISRRESKRQEAMDLGCTDYIATADEAGWETKNSRRLDLIISTVSSPKMPLADYIGLLRLDGTLVQVGLPEGQLPFRPGSLTGARRRIAGSSIGSPAEIKEMLQLVADKKLGIVIKPEFYPYTNGTDVSGEVVSVGPDQVRFKPGDRVVGHAMAWQKGENKYGAFQDYSIMVEPMVAKIPYRIPFKEAAVLPMGLATSSAMLFSPTLMGLDLPMAGTEMNSKGKVVVVWGGSSSVGSNAIQTAKAAGYIIAATASEHNHGLLREMNVDYVFDYKKDGIAEEIINTLSGIGDLAGVYCAVYSDTAITACATIADRLQGKKCLETILPPGLPVPGTIPDGVQVLINDHVLPGSTETGKRIWVDWLPGALEDGTLMCMPHPEVVGKGLEEIQDAVDAIGKGVSGKKLVVEL